MSSPGNAPTGSPQGYGQSYPMNYGMPYGGSMYGSPYGYYGGSFVSPYGGSPYGQMSNPYGFGSPYGGYGSPYGSPYGSQSGMPSFGGKGQAQFTPAQPSPPASPPDHAQQIPSGGTYTNINQLPPGSGLPPGYQHLTNQIGPGVNTGVYYPPGAIGQIPGNQPQQPATGLPQLTGSVGTAPPTTGIVGAPQPTPPAPIGTVSSGPYPAPVTTPMQPQIQPAMQSQILNRFGLGSNSSLPGIPSFRGRFGGTT